MIGMNVFQNGEWSWVKWRATRDQLLELGATRVMTDRRAEAIGIVVPLARNAYIAERARASANVAE